MATDLLVSLRSLGFSKEKTKRFVLYSQYRERSDRQQEHRVRHAAELVLVCYISYVLVSAPENMLRWW